MMTTYASCMKVIMQKPTQQQFSHPCGRSCALGGSHQSCPCRQEPNAYCHANCGRVLSTPVFVCAASCRNLTRDASAASLHMFGDSFSRPGSGSGPQHHHTRHNSTASSRDGGSPDHDAAPAEPLQHSGTSINMYTSAGTGPPGACGVYNSRSGSGRGGRGWGLGLGALTRPGGGSNKASDSGDAAIGMYQLGAAGTGGGGAQPPQQQQDAFAGFDVSEENQGVFVLDGGSDDRAQQQQQQQQQQWRGQQRPHQPPAGAAVELQQQQQQQQGAVPGGSSSMLAAMRHVGHVWGEFDRTVMQPVFGGPSTPRASDPGGGDGSSNQGQAPSNPSNQPL
jgi:hypothetical protein